MNLRLLVDTYSDVFFSNKLEEYKIKYSRREIPNGVYEVPFIEFLFYTETEFQQADMLFHIK